MIYVLDDGEYIVNTLKKIVSGKKIKHFRESRRFIEEVKSKRDVKLAIFDLYIEKKDVPSSEFFGKPEVEGFLVLMEFRKIFRDIPAILVTRYPNPDIFERVIQMEVIPLEAVNEEYLFDKLKNVLYELGFLTKEVDKKLLRIYEGEGYFFVSDKMMTCIKKVEMWKDSDVPILITGEPGVGKDALARIIHKRSGRKNRQFISFNIPAFPSQNLYQMLFGNEGGAYTGVKQNKGIFEQVGEGTLVLQEIGDISEDVQTMLLQVLEERIFRRMMGTSDIEFKGKLILTTNKNLQVLVNIGKFRKDLYSRIDGFHIHIPPLRERRKDIEFIINKLLGDEYQLSESAYDYLVYEYHYPGNVRQLLRIIQKIKEKCNILRSNLVTLGDVIEAIGKSYGYSEDFVYEGRVEEGGKVEEGVALSRVPGERAIFVNSPQSISGEDILEFMLKRKITIDELEKIIIREGLKKLGSSYNKRWEQLGFSRATFYRRLKEL